MTEIQNSTTSYIKVCVRVRPLSRNEAADSTASQQSQSLSKTPGKARRQSMLIPFLPRKTVAMLDNQVLIFDPSDANKEFVRGIPTHENRRTRDIQYAFDRVFGEQATQREVYQDAVRNLLEGVMEGVNATVFAYGATGAGKTHTISGNAEDPGIMPLCMLDLFEKIESSQHENLVDITVSYIEVYNETIRDLLNPGSGILDLREDASNQVVIAGLSEHCPKSYKDIMRLMELGNANRTKCSTKANEASSRSHAIFQINLQQRDKNSGISTQVRTATLTLCDLAGSERASVTDNRGQLLREGANINRSLLALGNCINALCDSKKSLQHIPFRDSKLTRLLKYSLGGNCRTVMIANISPALCHYEETHNTLKYAWRAKKIKMNVQKNSIDIQYHIGQYAELIASLQAEIALLRTENSKSSSSANPNIVVGYIQDLKEHCASVVDSNSDLQLQFQQCIQAAETQTVTFEIVFSYLKQFIRSLSEFELSAKLEEMLLRKNLDLIQGFLFQETKQPKSRNDRRQSKLHVTFAENKMEEEKMSNNDENAASVNSSNVMNSKRAATKQKSSRRRSFLPLPTFPTISSVSATPAPQNRRNSSIPRPFNAPPSFSKQPPMLDNVTEKPDLESELTESGLRTPEPKSLLDDLDDIDNFLQQDEVISKSQIAMPSSSKQRPPLQPLSRQQPLLATPRELRNYVSSSMMNSPRISTAMCSPFRRRN